MIANLRYEFWLKEIITNHFKRLLLKKLNSGNFLANSAFTESSKLKIFQIDFKAKLKMHLK